MLLHTTSDEVREIQNGLAHLGYMRAEEVTGTWTVHDKESLRTFQRKHRLKVTGEPDERTRARMSGLLARMG
jgi:N-acetyl-anhydromuramyl-L-alanine amidase AmpD